MKVKRIFRGVLKKLSHNILLNIAILFCLTIECVLFIVILGLKSYIIVLNFILLADSCAVAIYISYYLIKERHKAFAVAVVFIMLLNIVYLILVNRYWVFFATISVIGIFAYIIRIFRKNPDLYFGISRFFRISKKDIKKVSVVIPNYNYAKYLDARIDSILNQTYPIYELIILDDASTDASVEYIEQKIKSLKKTRSNLPIIRTNFNKKNSGNVFRQWGKAFSLARGDYVWIAEADDLADKHFLNAMMKNFLKNKKTVISYAESCSINENGKILEHNSRSWTDFYGSHRWDHNFFLDGKEFIAKHLSINNSIVNVSGVIFKNQKTIDFNKFLEKAQEFHNVGDWYFYEKILLHGDIAYYAKPLNYFRIHKGSVTRSAKKLNHFNEMATLRNIIFNDITPDPAAKEIGDAYMERQKRDWNISEDELYYNRVSLKSIINKSKFSDKDTLLSVVIPVYNTAPYLERCLKSILDDLTEKTEIIVINDGSTDNSEEIIEAFMQEYPQIRYIYQKNSGLAAVKNVGLKQAKGEYIIFLDSDDYIESGAYGIMLKKALDQDADLVCCDLNIVFDDKHHQVCRIFEKSALDNQLKGFLDCGVMASSCNKLVKKELYKGLEFPEKLRNEDVAVTPIVLARAKKIAYVRAPFYNYTQREGSINSNFSDDAYDAFRAVNICLSRTNNFSEEKQDLIESYLIIHQLIAPLLCWRIAELDNGVTKRNAIQRFCKEFNKMPFKNASSREVERYLFKNQKSGLVWFIQHEDYSAIEKIISNNQKGSTKIRL